MSMRKVRAELSNLREEVSAATTGRDSGAREWLAAMLINLHERLVSNPEDRPRSVIEKLVSLQMSDVEEAVAKLAESHGEKTALGVLGLAISVCPSHPAKALLAGIHQDQGGGPA